MSQNNTATPNADVNAAANATADAPATGSVGPGETKVRKVTTVVENLDKPKIGLKMVGSFFSGAALTGLGIFAWNRYLRTA